MNKKSIFKDGANKNLTHTKKKKGISLIVLIITIVVMIILAGSIVLTLNNSGIIKKASEAVDDTNLVTVRQLATLSWTDAYLESGGKATGTELYNAVTEALIRENIDVSKYELIVTTNGVTVNEITSIEQLEKMYTFAYYSTFRKAVADANEETTNNADANKEDAVAGIYIDSNGNTVVVLLKNTVEKSEIEVSRGMTINLGGHTLELSEVDAQLLIKADKQVVIDGRIGGSQISKNISTDTNKAQQLIHAKDTDLKINSGKYNIKTTSNIYTINSENSKVQLFDCEMVIETTKSCVGFRANSSQRATVQNCNIRIKSTTKGGHVYAIYVHSEAKVDIINCDIKADGYSDYVPEGETEVESVGVYAVGSFSDAEISINDGYYWGAREALAVDGTVRINGGTFEGCQHGGAYLCGTDIKIKNATFRNVDYTGEVGWLTSNWHGGAVYCGSSRGAVNIEFDNCRFETDDNINTQSGIVAKYPNVTIYISNCVIVGDYQNDLRADQASIKFYIGKDVVYDPNKVAGGGTFDTTTYAGEEFGNW